MVVVVADNTTQLPRSVVMVNVWFSIHGKEILTTDRTLTLLESQELVELINGDPVVLLEIEVFGMLLLLLWIKGQCRNPCRILTPQTRAPWMSPEWSAYHHADPEPLGCRW